jgi:iron complex outermembrane receptor protein
MNWNLTAAVFQRNSKNLIDYVKENENDLWKANNIGELKTSGAEIDIRYNLETKWNSSNSNYINISYTRINDNNYVKNVNFSRYSINSLKDQFISKLNINYLKNINHSITYKYGERSDKNKFSVLDSKIMYKKLFYLYVNNILDEVYSETNLVPMPGTNFLVGFTIGIN